jgi:hypothetical protein
MLRNVYGWSKNSDEPSTYIHLSGEAVKKALLQKAGVQQKAKAEPKVIMCPRCKCPNEPTATLCVKCKSVIRLQDAVSLSAFQTRLEEQTKIIEKLQVQVGQLSSAYVYTVFRREPTPELSKKSGEYMKQLKDAGLVAEK